MTYRARRRESARVVPVAPDRAAPVEYSVDCAREANRETAETAREGLAAIRLHDQVDVIVLNAELQDAKARSRGSRERAPDAGKDAVGS